MKILLIDNYDSFTYNLKQLLDELGAEVTVERNDKVDLEQIANYQAVIYSPGPGLPIEAGLLQQIIRNYGHCKPMLGICLGMQAMAEVYNGRLEQLDAPVHGKPAVIEHYGEELFKSVSGKFVAARYHSWVVAEDSIHQNFILTARDENGLVMGIKKRNYPMYGLQFHPESILTADGKQLLANFLEIANNYQS